jgi:CheY-like chemotaxis protein
MKAPTKERAMSRGSRTEQRILIASDNVDDAAQIVKSLKSEFSEVLTSTDAQSEVGDFESAEPQVLILAFNTIEKAQRYALGLYRFSQKVGAHLHRTILLCSKDEVRSAFELCKRGSFDDYVLYWPQSYDGHRLTMSVLNAMRQVSARSAEGPSHIELVSHVRKIGAMQTVLEQEVTEGERHADATRESLSDAQSAVGGAIDELLVRLSSRSANPIVEVKDQAALARAFDRLKNEPVSRAFKSTAKVVAPATAWTKLVRDKLAPHLEGLKSLGEKISKTRAVLMIVDDDKLTRSLIQKSLEGKSYELVFAHDGAAALALLRQRQPDLILMDVMLPDICGVKLTQKLKALPQFAGIPVLMLTGDARRETIEGSKIAGAVDFVVKPFTREALIKKLDRFLSASVD